MGSMKIPTLDFCSDPRALEQGTGEWMALSAEVREALEKVGVFQVAYGTPTTLSATLREDMFSAMKELFDLPVETKEKSNIISPVGYSQRLAGFDHLEAFGVWNAMELSSVQAFTDLMWQGGNKEISETLNSMSVKMFQVYQIVSKMVFDSFGVGRFSNAQFQSVETSLRMMKYKLQKIGEKDLGLGSHTDQGWLTVLCQDEVGGLLVQSNEGDWIQVAPSKGSLVVFAGDCLKGWSNGRIRAAKHKVEIEGNKERFSCTLFIVPSKEVTIEVAEELIDGEHPQAYKPFNAGAYRQYKYANGFKDDALGSYAGI